MDLIGIGALVTGGASGLGLATVQALTATGARAVILDLPSSSGAEVAAELGDGVRFVAADVRDEDQVQAAVDAAAGMGVLRVAVSCAGVATPGRVIGKRGRTAQAIRAVTRAAAVKDGVEVNIEFME